MVAVTLIYPPPNRPAARDPTGGEGGGELQKWIKKALQPENGYRNEGS